MRLINTKTLDLQWHNVNLEDGLKPAYAILSHTWGGEEVSYQDFQRPERRSKSGFNKIWSCCQQAVKDGLGWVWIDTCCIDKTNSSELSEAINSMYEWYWHAEVCYAYLEDVSPHPTFSTRQFAQSRWFQRGWCLQELIAPPKIEFYARDWSDIGTRWSLQKTITMETGIPSKVLLYRNLSGCSIAQKMSWAASRRTTKVEDMAYCLLGLFGIHMPLIYGEGSKAFTRLQAEIISQTEDCSFLIWSPPHQRSRWQVNDQSYSVLSQSPSMFRRPGPPSAFDEICSYDKMRLAHLDDKKLVLSGSATPREPLQMTSRGLRVHMYVRRSDFPTYDDEYSLWTGYAIADEYVCIQIAARKGGSFVTYDRVDVHNIIMVDAALLADFHLEELYLTTHDRFYKTKAQKNSSVALHDLVIETRTQLDSYALKFLGTFPKIMTEAALPNGEKGPEPPGELIYCKYFEEELALFKTGWGNWPLTFKFHLDIDGSSIFVFANLWLEHEAPRCFLWSCPGDSVMNDPLESDPLGSGWFQEDYYDQATDRADHRPINGKVVVSAMVKRGTKPRFGNNKLPYTVYITVFGS